ncbi:MAG: GH3 auxin-responsive promoter family protein [Bacteroidota bacterium]
MKTLITILFANYVKKRNQKWINNPIDYQSKTFKYLIKSASKTAFGRDHKYNQISNYSDYTKQVPVRDYEGLKPYIEKVISGEENILWPGKPKYFAKTSGTTSGAKYIPITKESIKTHIKSARNALLNYFLKTRNFKPIRGKHMFLQGSPELEKKNGILVGRLSGISAHYVPKLFLTNRKPSWSTNCIEDWEEKVNKIIDETVGEKMTIIAGIPSWVQMYFEKIVAKENRSISQVFPDLNLYVYGGVSYEPYRSTFDKLFGKSIDTLATFPASEGFFGYQDEFNKGKTDLLLLLNNDIFYEFIKTEDFLQGNENRIQLKDVELNVNYLLIISTSAGLWSYNIGDTVKFTSLQPYRIIVTGRVKHYLSAFGEHVISEEVENAIKIATKQHEVAIREFTVAPNINPKHGLPHHEWYIEFESMPNDLKSFSKSLDQEMINQNIYYKDLIDGKILKNLEVISLKKGSFNEYMKSVGRLGGQNKVPRLSNDRSVADKLNNLSID